jgi:hypothetical protein
MEGEKKKLKDMGNYRAGAGTDKKTSLGTVANM